MKDSQELSNEYQVVIIEVCENCETHQSISKHSEWKYFEQFNELKRKVEKFIPNTVVIKNPLPDELIKTPDISDHKNLFRNKNTQETITYPRVGAFEIYLYNILLSSKLLTQQWPNHYKVLQTLTKMIEDKKKNNTLDHYSVYAQTPPSEDPQNERVESKELYQESPEKKNVRISSKKKKGNNLAAKAYKSKSNEKGYDIMKDMKSTLDPVSHKLFLKEEPSPTKKKPNRYLQSKGEARVKLPALSNTMAPFRETPPQKSVALDKKAFNTINETEQEELSIIQKKQSEFNESRKFSILDMKSQDMRNNSIASLKHEELKFFQDHSVQFSQPEAKDIMNRSIQYEEEEGFYCDFGMQIDHDRLEKQRQLNYQWVQTEKVQMQTEPSPYLLDQEVQVQIMLKVPSDNKHAQTPIVQFVDENIATEMIISVSREIQFPEQVSRMVNLDEVVDASYKHLYEKRRNLIDNEECYSIDRFQQKASKYKWIGRAHLEDSPLDSKKKMFIECLVFSVYNYYGIKTPEKRLSYQMCTNVVGQKAREGLLHILTFDNPQLQYLTSFEDVDLTTKKIPLAELITFKSSRQQIKFSNYGGLLALAYFLNDFELFDGHSNQLGLVVVNQNVKEIHKLSALNYEIHPQIKNNQKEIVASADGRVTIKLDRLSQAVELEFFSMLTRICDSVTIQELINYLEEIFLHSSNSYQQFKMTMASLRLQDPQEQTVKDFIRMLEHRVQRVRQLFKGKIYTYKKYHSLSPIIKYSIPFEHKIERKLHFKDKIVTFHDIGKHLRNNNSIVIIQGADGAGKTTLLGEITDKLKSADKINVMNMPWLGKEPIKIKEQMFQLSKNILLIDNAQHFTPEVIELIQLLGHTNIEFSSCILTNSASQTAVFKNRFSSLNVISTILLPITPDEIKEYMMKVVKCKSYTEKKDIVETVVQNRQYTRILENPFYLSLYSSYLSGVDTGTYKPRDSDFTQYSILKQSFLRSTTAHAEQIKEMGLNIRQALPDLRRLAFEYYHNGQQITQTIKDIMVTYQQEELIRSQLVYYPLNLDSLISVIHQSLFSHQLFLKYFLVEGYSYFVEKGFRNMRMEKLYSDLFLMNLITQRYRIQGTHGQLLDVVFSTKKFKVIAEASSNALTLLSKMQYVFSNLNFDDCIVPLADLSNSVFYQCSFRGADLQQAVLYKAQMVSCVFDGAAMSRINLFSRKYEVQFAAMTMSISVDNRRLAFGCGNYLLIVNAETGSEVKRIEAHLDVIRLVRYTRDGNSLVTIADDKTLRIWDIYTFKSVVFKLPQKGSISYSNETQTIASVSKSVLKVWNLKSMANQAELEGHTEAITSIQFSIDGQLILTGSRDSTLRLWTLKGKQRTVFKGHDEEVLVGKLSPAKRTMVSSSRGKDLIMWQIQSSTKLASKKFKSDVTQICLDNKQKYILITFHSDNHIIVLDFLTLDIVHALTGHQSKIVSLSFDHNFQQLISLGKDRTARVWQFEQIMNNEVRHPKITTKIKKGPVLAIAYDKMKLLYVTSHQNGELNIWKGEDNTLIDQLMSHNGPVRCLAIDKSSKIYSGGSDGALRIWNLSARKEPKTIDIHSSEMVQLKLSERNRLIATSSNNNQLVIYDFTGIKIVMSTREEGKVNAIAFSHDEKLMAVGGAQKYVVIYEVINSSSVNRSEELGQHSDAVSSITFFGDFLLVVALKNGQVAIWNHHRASLIKKIENVSPIRCLLQFQKKYIVFTSEDGKVRIVNMDEGRQVRVFRHSEAPMAIDMNEDESLLISGTSGGNIIKWNLNCVRPPVKKVQFDRKAIDQECTKIVSVQSGRSLRIKDLFYHKEDIVDAKIQSDIEGVTFDDDKIIMLLKNGRYWQYGRRQYKFNNVNTYEGDLHSIRDKYFTNFFKSGLKKIKGMNKPSLWILEEVNHQ